MNPKFYILLTSFLSICSWAGFVDDYDIADLKKRYSDDMGVYAQHNQIVNISVDDVTGELIIEKTIHQKIIFLKESAKFYSSQSVPLSEYFEELTEIDVTVFNPDSKPRKLIASDFSTVDAESSSWVFHDDAKSVVFDLGEIGEGTGVEMKYTKRVKHPEFFDIFYLSSGYPIINSKIEIKTQAGVELAYFEKNLDGYDIQRVAEIQSDVDVKSWSASNLEPYEEEKEVYDVRYYLPHVVVQIRGFEFAGKKTDLVGDVDELHKLFAGFLLLKKEETNLPAVHDIADEICEGLTTDLEKIDTIYSWVQHNIKYIAFEDGINGYVPRTCSSVLKNRYGDCKDMTTLLVEMLTHVGVEKAYVAWVGTREIPYLMSEIPSPLSCNHVICVVEKDEGGYYYLDATSSEAGFLRPPSTCQGKELLIHKNADDYELLPVEAVPSSDNYIKTKISYVFNANDSLEISGVDYYGGYEREKITYSLKNLESDDLRNYIKGIALGGHNRHSLKEFSVENLEENNKELELKYSFNSRNPCLSHGEELIINPSVFKPRITKYNREKDLYTRYKDHHRTIGYEYTVTIPEEYELKFIPENVNYKNDEFSFTGEFRVNEQGQLIVILEYNYDLLKIDPEQFEEWNSFSKAVNLASIQNIILVKKAND